MSPEEATFFFLKVFFCNLLKVAAGWTGRPEMLILRLGGGTICRGWVCHQVRLEGSLKAEDALFCH